MACKKCGSATFGPVWATCKGERPHAAIEATMSEHRPQITVNLSTTPDGGGRVEISEGLSGVVVDLSPDTMKVEIRCDGAFYRVGPLDRNACFVGGTVQDGDRGREGRA